VTPTKGGSNPLSALYLRSRQLAHGGSFSDRFHAAKSLPSHGGELVRELPEGRWQYEPKWDGFRGVLENDGGELRAVVAERRPLLRYFPELRPLGDLLRRTPRSTARS
jgi:hypothetical protein